MAQVVRPLIQWPRWHRRYCSRAALDHFLIAPSPSSTSNTKNSIPRFKLFLSPPPSSLRSVHFSSRAFKSFDVRSPPDSAAETDEDLDDDSSEEPKKSRNERKREARRAVRWGMQLANFSPTQIKRILRVASLEREVFDAIMLVKKLGRDVREGKRRQFNLIGKMLRDVEPELMDSLIQTTKDSDKDKFLALFGSDSWDINNDDYEEEEEEEEEEKSEHDDDEEDSQYFNEVTTRWYEGLINKDIGITNEIYSLQGVEFDRQELRRLVRRVQSTQEHHISSEAQENNIEAKFSRAELSLARFLRGLAKQISTDE